MQPKKVLIVGGSQGLGREIAAHYASKGAEVIVTGRDLAKAEATAREIGGKVSALTFDLASPEGIGVALTSVSSLDSLVLTAIERDDNRIADYDIARATYLVTMKLVGYTTVIHELLPRFPKDGGAIVLFGGLAKDRPYPGSTTVSTVNGGISTMVHTLAGQIAPTRINALHPGIVGDSPYWKGKTAYLEGIKARTPGGQLVTMKDIVGAVAFLLENDGVNGENLKVDHGWMTM
jgi:NAD(P)-dependent dehydrogenase (short-subunit alcohol dehydrogenase family)